MLMVDFRLNRLLIWVAIACLYGMYVIVYGDCRWMTKCDRWLMVYNSQVNPILLPVDTRYSSADPEVMMQMAEHWNSRNYGPKCNNNDGQCL